MLRFPVLLLFVVCVVSTPCVSAQETTYVFTDLGHADDLGSRANAINGRGVVVGSIMDLNTVESVPSGWVLTEARGINNVGQIVGLGGFGGSERAFLLTPVLFGEGFEDGTFDGWDNVVP